MSQGKWYTYVTKQFGFDAAHRVLNHEGKCKNLHGHRYEAFVTVHAPELDDLGRAIDFGEIKRLVGGWIDSELDHNTILHPEDPLWQVGESIGDPYLVKTLGREPYRMPDLTNPTAEEIAAEIARHAQDIIGRSFEGLTITAVRLYETPTSFADYRLEYNGDDEPTTNRKGPKGYGKGKARHR